MPEEKEPLFDETVNVVRTEGKAACSLLQRRLKIGYAYAARLMDEMEEAGIIGPANGGQPRNII